MYREKIREYYDHLSRSYRKVADYIMSNYYEVAFMTAAQLAYAVGVDTTTVVRFSQRLGYNGYPELLQDVREQVKSEIYAAYEPQILSPEDPAGAFRDRISQEQQNLRQLLVHNPPEHVEAIARLLAGGKAHSPHRRRLCRRCGRDCGADVSPSRHRRRVPPQRCGKKGIVPHERGQQRAGDRRQRF